MTAQISVTRGRKWFEARDVPRLFAEARYPTAPDKSPHVQKFLRDRAERDYRHFLNESVRSGTVTLVDLLGIPTKDTFKGVLSVPELVRFAERVGIAVRLHPSEAVQAPAASAIDDEGVNRGHTAVEPVREQKASPIRPLRTKGPRSDILDGAIEMARTAASDPNDYHQVWMQLVRIADQRDPPVPLRAYLDGKGVEYEGASGLKYLNKRALKARFDRSGLRRK